MGTALRASFSRISLITRSASAPVRVHLIDKGDAGDAIAFHLLIDREGLALDATDRTQHHDGSIEHTQGTLDLDREVHVTRSVDQVDGLILPVDLSGGRGDGDTSLTL